MSAPIGLARLASIISLTLLFVAPTVAADNYSGYMIPPGHRGPSYGVSATMLLQPCTGDGVWSGVDGYWFELNPRYEDAGDPVIATMDATVDVDLYFYDADCGYIVTNFGRKVGLGVEEDGYLPDAAAFLFVANMAGFGNFKVEIA